MGCRSCGPGCLSTESVPSGWGVKRPISNFAFGLGEHGAHAPAQGCSLEGVLEVFERWWFERLFCTWRKVEYTYDTAIYGRPAPLRTADSSALLEYWI